MVVLLMSKPEKNKTEKQTNRTPDIKKFYWIKVSDNWWKAGSSYDTYSCEFWAHETARCICAVP